MAAPSDDPMTPPAPSRRRAAVVTASDRSAAGEREDASGPAVAALLEAEGYAVTEVVVVPDERDRIAAVLTRLADEDDLALVAVTGGTGFAPRDVTPEATRDVIDREAPGLAEAMRAQTSRTTPNAFLSRGVCGVRGTTLILNLPGSPSGATESLAAVLGLLPHAMAQIVGGGDHAETTGERTETAPAGASGTGDEVADLPASPPAAAITPPAPSAPEPPSPAPRSPEPPPTKRRGLASLLGRSKELDAAQRAAVLESLVLASGEDLPELRAAAATLSAVPPEAAPTPGTATTADHAGAEDPVTPVAVPEVAPPVVVSAPDAEADAAPPAPDEAPPDPIDDGSAGASDEAAVSATDGAAAEAIDTASPEGPSSADLPSRIDRDATDASTQAAPDADAPAPVDGGGAPTTPRDDDAETEADRPQAARRGLLGRVRDRLAGDDGPATGLDDDLDDLDGPDDEDDLQDLRAEAIAGDLVDELSVDVDEVSTPRPRLVSFGWAEDAQDAVGVDRGADTAPGRDGEDAFARDRQDDEDGAPEDDRRAAAGRRGRSRRRRDRAVDGPPVLDGRTDAAETAPSAGSGTEDEGGTGDRAPLPEASARGEADVDASGAAVDATGQARPSRLGRLAGTATDWLTAAAIVMVVLAMATLLASDQPPVTVGEVPLPTVAQPEAPEEPADPDAEPEPIIVATIAPPTTIRIPTITVDATVVPVGLEPDGAMEIPRDVQTIGWYDPQGYGGVVPGSNGTAVLSGHVDSRSQGPGAFYYLRNLGLGDEIEVVHEDGTVTRWIVTGRTQYDKDVIPLEEIFVWEGAPRLALITCGGEFDRTARSYRDNIVVLAEPLTA